MSTPVYVDATRSVLYQAFMTPTSSLNISTARYHARTRTHSDEPDPNRSWYKPRDKSESSGRVGDRVISDVVSKTKVSSRTLSMARRFYNALKSYLTWIPATVSIPSFNGKTGMTVCTFRTAKDFYWCPCCKVVNSCSHQSTGLLMVWSIENAHMLLTLKICIERQPSTTGET